MSNTKIKLTNISGHGHGVTLRNAVSGITVDRDLQPNQFVLVDIDQFVELWTSTHEFKMGIWGFDTKAIPEEYLEVLGMETAEEVDLGIVGKSDLEIKKVLKGQIGEFNAFMKEVKELDETAKGDFSRRVFTLAQSIYDDLAGGKLKTIEKTTGFNFEVNEKEESK